MSATSQSLRNRFMAALARQQCLLVPTTDNESCYDAVIFSINDPFISTNDGDYWMAWRDSMCSKDWLYKVHDSKMKTIVVNANLVHEEMTDEHLDIIARDGGYRMGDEFYQVYLRVC